MDAQGAVGAAAGGQLGVGAGQQQPQQVEPPHHRGRPRPRIPQQPGRRRLRQPDPLPAPGQLPCADMNDVLWDNIVVLATNTRVPLTFGSPASHLALICAW